MQNHIPIRRTFLLTIIHLVLLGGLLAGCCTRAPAQASGTAITLPSATIGTAYEVRLSLDGMQLANPATVTVDSAGRPAWLNFDASTGLLSANPAQAPAQTYSFSIVITDANAKTTHVTAKLDVKAANSAPVVPGEELELPDAFQGLPYQSTVPLPAGVTVVPPPVPALPNGLAINPAGLINGAAAGGGIEGAYHGTLALAGGALNSLRIKFRLYLSPPVAKLYSPCAIPADKRPIITATLSDLSTTISGMASVPTNCIAKIAVWTIDPELTDDYLTMQPTQAQLQDAHANAVQVKSGADVAADGTFSVLLMGPPRAGQTIVLEQRLTDSSQNSVGSVFSRPIPVHFAGDWGRVKTYFTSGILLSQDQGSFSQSSLFLSFLLDKSWVLSRPIYGRSHLGPGVNTFFETRLTSVPVTAQPCPTDNSTTSGQCTSQTGSDVFNTFLTSQKTARLAAGAYLPFVTKVWTYNGVRNGLFVAPLAKVGFDTPVSAINQSQAQSQSNSSGNTPGTVIVPVNNSSFYNFYVYGARIGHVALPAPEKRRNSENWAVNEAPETNSYLDVTVGRFSNLQTVLNNGLHTRLYRINLEGILKVPSTPLVIGFNANLGQANVGVNSANISKRASDDLRFLLGAKFDVGKITSYLSSHAF